MEIKHILGFTIDSLTVYDTEAFLSNDTCMLVCPDTGTTLSMDYETFKDFENHKVSDDLVFLMVQRAIAKYKDSRPLSNCYECVLPEFFLIDLTKSCNLSCKYCFRELNPKNPKITHEKLNEICSSLITYWKAHPQLHITIQAWGGEPLLELSSIVEIRNFFNEANLFPEIIIETNGTLITPDVAKILFENDIKLGISIDGNSIVHNAQRPLANGKNSLELVENGIYNIRNAGYKNFGSITVVTKNTLENLDDIIKYFAYDLHLSGIKLNMMHKNEKNHDLAMNIEDIETYIDKLLKNLHELYQDKVSIIEQNISQRLSNLMFRTNANICNSHGCHGGYRMLSIDTVGNVYPCELTDYPDYRLGNIDDSNYIEMVEKAISSNHEYFAKRNLENCKECPWLYFCRGGCRSAVKYTTGTTTNIDISECTFNKVLYTKLVEILLNDSNFAEYLLNGTINSQD